jgi:hypothetical protein
LIVLVGVFKNQRVVKTVCGVVLIAGGGTAVDVLLREVGVADAAGVADGTGVGVADPLLGGVAVGTGVGVWIGTGVGVAVLLPA